MRIGILTYHRALNYGAVLQCYALYSTLCSMGHDVEIIDYRPEAIEKYRLFFRRKDFVSAAGLLGKLKYVISSLLVAQSKKRTAQKFDAFLNKYFNLSSLVTSVDDVPKYYDYIVFGSDQIWSPRNNEGVDDVYLGNIDSPNTRFITYAVSSGCENLISGIYFESYKKCVSNFSSISVREESLQDCLWKNFKMMPEVVCDPSLFFSQETCFNLSLEPKDKDYILLFSLIEDNNVVKMAANLANELRCKVIEIKAVVNPCRKTPFQLCPELSPSEFLGFIKNATCVITNSFHATSFSLIMHKDFYTTLRPSNNDRAKTLLKVAGLSERQVDASKKLVFSKVNYDGVDEKLSEYRNKSLEYLKNNLY